MNLAVTMSSIEAALDKDSGMSWTQSTVLLHCLRDCLWISPAKRDENSAQMAGLGAYAQDSAAFLQPKVQHVNQIHKACWTVPGP